MTWIEIRPQDVWLFRDGKPFSAGEDHSAHSIFPPTPLTVQGALRQQISVSLKVSLRDYKAARTNDARKAIEYIGSHGELERLGQFTMRGPYIGLRTDKELVPLFPVPADLLVIENTDRRIIEDVLITEVEEPDFVSDFSGYQLPRVYEGYENLPAFWMTNVAFKAYLGDNSTIAPSWFSPKSNKDYSDAFSAYQDGKHIWHSKLVYENDNRFGVSTNALTSFREEGQLYQVGFVRPTNGIGLLAWVDDAIPSNLLAGPMTIGGEQRQANAVVVDKLDMPTRPKEVSGRFKVIFLTPAYFDHGWQPKNDDWSALFAEQSIKLKSAILYRPLKIGGWSNAAGQARTMHNYVAPGSVYYFEADKAFKLPYALTEHPVGINAQALGFGQYAIGQW